MLNLYRHHHHHTLRPLFIASLKRNASTSLATAPRPHEPDHYDEPEPEPEHNDEQRLSDAEWDARAGAAIDTLTRTLPHFLESGLHTRTDSSLSHLSSLTGFATSRDAAPSDDGEGEQIYDSRIRLSYTPPAELPAPLPRTLHVDGLPLYLASSMLLRHSLHAIYSPLTLTVTSVRVSSTRPPGSGPSIPSLPPSHRNGAESVQRHEKAYERQKSLAIGFDIDGRGRVGGKSAHWEIRSTYHFHPMHARIHRHVVDSIVPAPSSGVFDLLRSVLDGVGGRVGVPGVPGGCVSVDGGPSCDGVLKARRAGRWEGIGGVGGMKGCR
ncbi:hypothetical protein PENSPDRAFT_588724 [Peniophora sp. CONT]|nr:hypothetical protein PENSPDRAFT_588724 [Peniophora sp. CONT]